MASFGVLCNTKMCTVKYITQSIVNCFSTAIISSKSIQTPLHTYLYNSFSIWKLNTIPKITMGCRFNSFQESKYMKSPMYGTTTKTVTILAHEGCANYIITVPSRVHLTGPAYVPQDIWLAYFMDFLLSNVESCSLRYCCFHRTYW